MDAVPGCGKRSFGGGGVRVVVLGSETSLGLRVSVCVGAMQGLLLRLVVVLGPETALGLCESVYVGVSSVCVGAVQGLLLRLVEVLGSGVYCTCLPQDEYWGR